MKNQATRKKKSDEKIKVSSPDKFMKNQAAKKKGQATRKKKSDINLKAKNLSHFQKANRNRIQKYNEKTKKLLMPKRE